MKFGEAAGGADDILVLIDTNGQNKYISGRQLQVGGRFLVPAALDSSAGSNAPADQQGKQYRRWSSHVQKVLPIPPYAIKPSVQSFGRLCFHGLASRFCTGHAVRDRPLKEGRSIQTL
jgi:hypothetical protein